MEPGGAAGELGHAIRGDRTELFVSARRSLCYLRETKVAAMETSESDAAVASLRRAEERDGYYDLEHLPPLLEDEVRRWGGFYVDVSRRLEVYWLVGLHVCSR